MRESSSQAQITRLVPLSQRKDYKVAKGDPDVRGWDVVAVDDRRVGQVHELIVDLVDQRVRYLDVSLDDAIFGSSRHVLLPLGLAELDTADDRVLLTRLGSLDLGRLPVYDHAPITREYESTVRSAIEGKVAGPGAEADFYAHDHFNEERFYAPRRMPRGPGKSPIG